MKELLGFSRGIDAVSAGFGRLAEYAVLLCCLISAGNAIIRYAFHISSNGWLEIQWYLFGFVVLMGAAHTLRMNEHVRVDIIYGSLGDRARLWADSIGLVLLFLPFVIYSAWLSWPIFAQSFATGEISSNSGGLIRWPAKLIIAAGFTLLALQGVSELIKRAAGLRGDILLETKYEKPLQ